MGNLTRRDLLKGLGLGSVVLASGGALAACSPNENETGGAAKTSSQGSSYQFAKRKSDIAGMTQTETDVLAEAERACAPRSALPSKARK